MVGRIFPIKILILLTLASFVCTTVVPPNIVIDNQNVQTQQRDEPRMLQTVNVEQNQAKADFDSLFIKLNKIRAESGFSLLTINTRLAYIINQWFTLMKSRIDLLQYLQIFGIVKLRMFEFDQLPAQYLTDVVLKQCKECVLDEYKEIGYFIQVSEGKYNVILAVTGGFGSRKKSFDKKAVQDIVQTIRNERKLDGDTKQPAIIQVETSEPTIEVKTGEVPKVQSTPNSPQIPVILEPKPTVDPQPVKPIQQPITNESLPQTQLLPLSQPQRFQSSPQQPPIRPPPTVTLPSNIIQTPQLIQKTLPLITQTTFGKTPLENLVLDHSIPSNFLKSETFFFKGSLTQPNPTGTFVNVVFTHITDSKKLQFEEYLPTNVVNFQVPALLDMTGQYYLAIFTGDHGIAGDQIYTINPGYIGSVISRPPVPIRNASLSLLNNNLWLEWFDSDVSQPCLTKLNFTQLTGQSIIFTLSNYVNKFKIPFSHFSFFKAGTIIVELSQAFSTSQSAKERTSEFSEAFSFTFEATQHHFVWNKDQTGIQPLHLLVPINTFITFRGVSKEPISNEIVVITPKNTFESYKVNTNKKASDILPAGTPINVSIRFDTVGVYIVQVSDSEGIAIINTPFYVGGIYPLLPDFKDLFTRDFDSSNQNFPSILSSRRYFILDQINIIRQKYGAEAVFMDDNLNSIAQNCSQNAVSGNSLNSQSISDKAKALGIFELVDENLASSENLTQAQLYLQRAPSSLRKMVRKSWTRVGVGIAQNSQKIYYLTQTYTSRNLKRHPLTTEQLQQIKQQVQKHIIKKHSQIKSQNTKISKILEQYLKQGSPGALSSFLKRNGVNDSIMPFDMTVLYNGGDYLELVDQKTNFDLSRNPQLSQVALTVQIVKGQLEIFGLLA